MTEAEKAAALADEIERRLDECATVTHGVSAGSLIVRALRRLAETEADPAGNLRKVVTQAIRATRGCAPYCGPEATGSEFGCACQNDADAALSAISAAGYAVVPREPTEEMVEAAERAAWKHIYIGEDSDEEPVIIGVDKGMRAALRAALTTKEGRP